MREQIYRLVARASKNSRLNKFYNLFIMLVAFLSLLPLTFKVTDQTSPLLVAFLDYLDIVTVYILFADYILRWIVYDKISVHYNAPAAFFVYPFTPFAIMDLLSLLPSLGLLGPAFRILRVLRFLKVLHYSKTFIYISNVFVKEKKKLLSVLIIALAYIFISALIMFAYEPDSFNNFFHALYWATTALTTVGYGDVYPVSDIGKLISMISSLFGIAVIAMPAGIVTAGFVDEMDADKKDGGKTETEQTNREDKGAKTDEN